MASLWSIIVPEAGTNDIPNPSAETTGNFAAHNSATVTRDTTYARFGDYSYKIVPGGTNRGVSLTTTALSNEAGYVSFYVFGTITGNLQVSQDAGGNYNTAAIIGGATGSWVRYGVAIAQAQRNGSTATIIRNSANETFYVDGVLSQNVGYATTYIDGDQGPLYRWTGLRHGSTSTRDAQDRLGGRERDLADYGAYVTGYAGLGQAPVVNNLVGQALQPGAAFQSTKIMPRVVTLNLNLSGTSLENLHSLRQDLIDLVKPSRVRGNQPFVLGYSGAKSTTKVYAAFRYDGGLELTAPTPSGFVDRPPLRLVAVDPYWYEDNRETASLTLYSSVTGTRANRRVSGQWAVLGTGFNGTVRCMAYDKQRNRVYFGGAFTTANGVTVNGVCYWNGTTFVAMDSGVGAGAGTLDVYALAIAANGDVWVGGKFRTVGSGAAATKGLARWSVSGSSWTAFNESTGGTFGGVYSVVIKSTGQVVIAGDFVDWEGDSGSDYICKTDDNGVNWDTMGTTPFAAALYPATAQSLAFDASGNLWAGSYRNTGTSTASVFKWDGSTWTTVLTTDSRTNAAIRALYFTPDGLLYLGGLFSTLGGISAANIAVYNNTSVSALGSGITIGGAVATSAVYTIAADSAGIIYAGGNIAVSGTVTGLVGLASWNGSVWIFPDISLTSLAVVYAIQAVSSDVYLGHDSAGGSTTSSAITTISPTATASVYPTFTAIGPTSDYAVLQSIENVSTGHRLYFNVQVFAGETLTITLMPGQRQVVSDWRGVIANLPLSNSDWAAWHLLGSPAANTIAAFMGFTTTGAALLAHWQPRHLSVDGPA